MTRSPPVSNRTRWNVRRRPGDDEWRASFSELFFDLVFVLVITQLSALLFEHLTLVGAAQTLFLLLVAWWAWIYTTWATNWFDPELGPVRAVLVGGMATSTILALLYVPVAYTYVDSFGKLIGRLVSWRPRLPFRKGRQQGAEPSPEAGPARRHAGVERMPLPVAGGAPTSEEPGFTPRGLCTSTDSTWVMSGPDPCATANRIYCFEQ